MKKLFTLFAIIVVGLFMESCQVGKSPVIVSSDGAPKAIGPYSQAIKAGKMIYCSGQIGLNPASGSLAGDDIAAQARQALDNLKAVLLAGKSDMGHVVKVTIYLKDLGDYAKVNDIYKDYFPALKPARSTVQVARLPKDALIEIDCTATVK